MIIYQLNPSEKIYIKADIKAEIEGMAKKIAEDSQIVPTDEIKKIAGYNCVGNVVTS